LQGLDNIVVDKGAGRRTLLDDIRMISGTSGGAVTAAYFGYKGRGYKDLRERFLFADAEKELHTSKISPLNWLRIYEGGVNDRSTFADWLDRNVFDGMTYSAFGREGAPLVWITASDINNGTPFVFAAQTFAALCSDLNKIRIADSVAASAAFPVVFTPVVISTVAARQPCGYRHPAWLDEAMSNPEASLRLKSFAATMLVYQGNLAEKYIKLLDGGLTDNIGVTGFSLERAAATTPHSPLSAEEAIRLQDFVYLVVDAGVTTKGQWVDTVRGPKFRRLIDAIANAGIRSSVRDEFDALKLAMAAWHDQLVAWRCGLSAEEVRRLRGSLEGWNCRDVEVTVEALSFADLPATQRAKLNDIPTRLKLSTDDVELAINAGAKAVNTNARLRAIFARPAGHQLTKSGLQ
jgi:NTE family protein